MKCKIKNQELKYLLTCNHVISQKEIDEQEEILIFYGKINQEIKKNIILNKNERFTKTFEDSIDITIIEILRKDSFLEDKFLFPDLNYKNGFYFYKNKDFFLAGYPEYFNEERAVCSGKIKGIKIYSFFHSMETEYESSGSPIILKDNICIIGIHTSGVNNKKINLGAFIGFILDNLENEDIKKLSHDKKEKNYIQENEAILKEFINKKSEISNYFAKLKFMEEIKKELFELKLKYNSQQEDFIKKLNMDLKDYINERVKEKKIE